MNSYLMVFFTAMGAIGVALIFVGTLVSALTAIGNKCYLYGVLILLFFPTAFLYCTRNWAMASYPGKLLCSGAAFLLPALIYAFTIVKLYGPP